MLTSVSLAVPIRCQRMNSAEAVQGEQHDWPKLASQPAPGGRSIAAAEPGGEEFPRSALGKESGAGLSSARATRGNHRPPRQLRRATAAKDLRESTCFPSLCTSTRVIEDAAWKLVSAQESLSHRHLHNLLRETDKDGQCRRDLSGPVPFRM